jgi:hypothetical protein
MGRPRHDRRELGATPCGAGARGTSRSARRDDSEERVGPPLQRRAHRTGRQAGLPDARPDQQTGLGRRQRRRCSLTADRLDGTRARSLRKMYQRNLQIGTYQTDEAMLRFCTAGRRLRTSVRRGRHRSSCICSGPSGTLGCNRADAAPPTRSSGPQYRKARSMPSNHVPPGPCLPDHGSRNRALVIVLIFVIVLVLLGYPLPTALAAVATAGAIAVEVAHLVESHLHRGGGTGLGRSAPAK